MALQLIGTTKCKQTQKAQRWLKDRRMEFHFLDLSVKPLSLGELTNIAAAVGGPQKLIDTGSKAFEKRGLKYMDYEPLEELISQPEILTTPILRQGRQAVVGFDDKTYAAFLAGL